MWKRRFLVSLVLILCIFQVGAEGNEETEVKSRHSKGNIHWNLSDWYIQNTICFQCCQFFKWWGFPMMFVRVLPETGLVILRKFSSQNSIGTWRANHERDLGSLHASQVASVVLCTLLHYVCTLQVVFCPRRAFPTGTLLLQQGLCARVLLYFTHSALPTSTLPTRCLAH